MNRISKRNFWIGGAFCLVVIGLIAGAMRPKHVSGAQPSASPDVEVVQVEQKDVPIFGEWIGTLDGFTNADVRAQVAGYLLRQGYQEGAFVKKGQLLFEIDPRPFQAALDQAEGQLAQATAQLANSEAVQGRTELDVNRYTPLAREQAASQQDLDNAIQNNMAAKATVATAKAQIKSAAAAVALRFISLSASASTSIGTDGSRRRPRARPRTSACVSNLFWPTVPPMGMRGRSILPTAKSIRAPAQFGSPDSFLIRAIFCGPAVMAKFALSSGSNKARCLFLSARCQSSKAVIRLPLWVATTK